ncbi:MAG TPA: C40 family peptidase, partial [Pseudonocardia sp.]|nr:C40 family peptidase [Pseudonocardia sp.]
MAEHDPSRALAAVKVALAQIGLPYVWGGDGPANGDEGFDCSGLTHFAYAMAGISLPRTAHTQFYAGPQVPAGDALHPGDLVFYGTSTFVHHVGMYIGAGRMVNAPTFGEPVQVAYYRWLGDDYIGATRPDDSSVAGVVPVPPVPERPSVPRSGPFVAPRAPLPVPLPVIVAAAPVPEAESAAAVIAEERQLGVTAPPVSVAAPPGPSGVGADGPALPAPEAADPAAVPP